MELDPLPPHPPLQLLPRATSSSRRAPSRDMPIRSQKSLGSTAGLHDAKPLPQLPVEKPKGVDTKPPAMQTSASAPTSLLPAAARRHGDATTYGAARKQQAEEDSGWEMAPDGASAGRDARHFTVSNVGNNGKIYLRPSVRPANQRYPQPNFAFPITPPSTAGLDVTSREEDEPDTSILFDSQISPWTLPSDPGMAEAIKSHDSNAASATSPQHRRAVSESTAHESDAGAFKVVIAKPQEARSKTTEDIDPNTSPMLKVSIPSWRLGTPRFSTAGTPILRGSYCAPDSARLSCASVVDNSLENSLHHSLFPNSRTSAHPSLAIMPHITLSSPNLQSPDSAKSRASARATYMPTRTAIRPSMFDALTFSPSCDDRGIVRYSAAGVVTAATPPRLVAEITSPNFLDYELISDFFLTYRSFLETRVLLRMLIARLRWSFSRDDQTGMIVRVRSFVAIRHWILNYFVDDFVVDHDLRVTFCNLLNDFFHELAQAPQGRKVQLKILAELKKCWRRVCSQFWDGPEFDCSLNPEAPVVPGGIAGHRNPGLDPSFWESDSSLPPHLRLDFLAADPLGESSFRMDVDRAGLIDSVLHGDARPTTPLPRTVAEEPSKSPISVASLDVVSCSFPTKGLRMLGPPSKRAMAAHPVAPSSIYTSTDPTAPTPRALTGKRVRPKAATHKRKISTTDSMRERSRAEKVEFKNADFYLTLPYAGSLVRGNLLPPGHAFVDVGPNGPHGSSRHTTFLQPRPAEGAKDKGHASAMSGAGMRKLLAGVRRALGNGKGSAASQTQECFLNVTPIGPRGVTTNRIPGTPVVPQARPERPNGFRPPVRIDMLGAESAEEFKRAVESNVDVPSNSSAEVKEYSAAHLDSSFDLQPPNANDPDLRSESDAAITTGSQSIVIVDDTFPVDTPAMSGALPRSGGSADERIDSFVPSGMANLTPPNTPPGQQSTIDAPENPSETFRQAAHDSLSSTDPLPPFVPDLATLGNESASPSEDDDATERAFSWRLSSQRSEVLSSGNGPSEAGHHARQPSSHSQGTRRSIAERRWASFQSTIQRAVKSFDATTTYTEPASETTDIMPLPLRALRRRPGGDLKGVQNVAELDALPVHRSQSIDTFTTCSESGRSSFLQSPLQESSGGFVDIVSSDYSRQHPEVFSLGALAEKSQQQRSSLCSTTVMRPSFEVQAERLASIPDDTDDDGGIESALAKLEGTWTKKSSSVPSNTEVGSPTTAGTSEVHEIQQREKWQHRHQHIARVGEEPVPTGREGAQTRLTLRIPDPSESSFLSDRSADTYSSTPILERGMRDDVRGNSSSQWSNRSILRDPGASTSPANGAPRSSFEVALPGQTGSEPGEEMSFLDMSDNDSDLSSELSDELEDNATFSARRPGAISTEVPVDVNAEVHHVAEGEPPSPPVSVTHASRTSREASHVPQLHDHQIWDQGASPLPPTPDTTPTAATHRRPLASPHDATGTKGALRDAPDLQSDSTPQLSAHLPFILAFDSEVLAQQFTLIEKDALNEVDWQELIDMRWKNSHSDSRSWVEFLRNSDARGVEVVIARFNIMVKWTISEIVLTQDIEERARCIMKFLHIAAHCRRYRNFATMSQITVALTSNEISRLTKTWAMLPPHDLKTMRDLETLVSPTKNFHNMRAEMEGGAIAACTGCIPFVGIYTHDLLFNSQRPSEIATSPNSPPLVNFERCRIAASVVKTLLRLLEASTLYEFQPIEGITERCLWMSALNDDEIRRHSESLESPPPNR